MCKTGFRILFFCLGLSFYSQAQDFSALWQAHFSYNNIVDVVGGNDKIYAAAQNAVFEYNTQSQELKTITTIDGLSGEQITTIHYSTEFQYLVIGYETGLMEVYSESDGSVLTVVDILEKDNITPVNKNINHFYEHEGLVYISTDYGISVYDLARLEFGDTFFLGNGGSQIIVNQVTVLNNEIFAACSSVNGLKKADLSNPNLIDFSQWQTLTGGNFINVNTVADKAYAM
jgi:WD40 repeat protein